MLEVSTPKEIVTPKSACFFVLPIADRTVKSSGRDHGWRKNTLTRDQLLRSEDLSGDLQGCSEKSQPVDDTNGDAEARNDFRSIEWDFIYRHHVEPRVQLHVPKEETFQSPLKYIDRTRTTHTNLGVFQESCVDEFWNVAVDRNLSKSWTGFMKFTLFNEKPPKGCTWSESRSQKIQATTRPDHLLGLKQSDMSRAPQRKKKKHRGIDKPKLDNARKPRGICFIDPDDEELMETIENARKKLVMPMEAAVPCTLKTTKRQNKLLETDSETNGSNKIQKTLHGPIVEPHEFSRKPSEPTLPTDHEDHIAEKGFNSIRHYNLVHKKIQMPQPMKILEAKPAVDNKWKKLETLPAVQ